MEESKNLTANNNKTLEVHKPRVPRPQKKMETQTLLFACQESERNKIIIENRGSSTEYVS